MRVYILSIVALLFIGCSKTTVVLADSGKKHNAIVVKTDKGSVTLDKVGSYVDLKAKDKAPSSVKRMSKEQMKRRFNDVINSAPAKPISYLLYFKPNSLELTQSSKELLSRVLETIKERTPCMVDIIGHTDTVGSSKSNLEVSLKRAKYIASMIKKMKIKVVSLSVKGYGERDLLVKTADNISNAQNRNVEIFIK